MTITFSIVGTRWQCAKQIRAINSAKNTGCMTKVEMKRIGLFTWYLYCEAEVKT